MFLIPCQIAYSIRRYIRVEFDIVEGEDIVKAAEGLSGMLLAQITINRDNRNSESEFYCWEWPIEGPLAGFIRTRGLLHAGSWKNFSPVEIAKLTEAPIIRSKLIVSALTKPIIDGHGEGSEMDVEVN
ncbi:23487_t:CDS:2 [Dentiscutata erythropus]|uniref:23487_t:CDS:1 n=1 Tax=Dentiscutata erythropus TaxID=1348616 RepID=A0A9N8WIA4_9GLOM|nr:23487_t:CDS:2 [Dentiscutata erythropus]